MPQRAKAGKVGAWARMRETKAPKGKFAEMLGVVWMDKFFAQKYCDRCGQSLKGGRIMSMFNRDCICLIAKKRKEKIRIIKRQWRPILKLLKKGILISRV